MTRIIKANSTRTADDGQAAVMDLADIAAEARTIVLNARKDAARVIAEAGAAAEATAQQAAEKGYAEGFARGQNDGYEDGHKQGAAEAAEQFAARAGGIIELAEKVASELAAARAEMLHRGRCELLDFALEIAAKIVGHVATADPQAARENLRKALELADSAREVCVKVNPAQLDDLKACLPKLVDTLGRTGAVRLAADEGIGPGGAKAVTGQGRIDATIETQMTNVVEALLGRGTADERAGRYVPVPETSHQEQAAESHEPV